MHSTRTNIHVEQLGSAGNDTNSIDHIRVFVHSGWLTHNLEIWIDDLSLPSHNTENNQ